MIFIYLILSIFIIKYIFFDPTKKCQDPFILDFENKINQENSCISKKLKDLEFAL